MSDNKFSRSAAGFTLVEVLIVISLMAIIGVGFLSIATHYSVVISRNGKLSEMTISSQNLLRSTVSNLRFGDGVRQTNEIYDANAPGGTWNTSDTNFVIIIRVPALDTARNYIIDPETGSPYMNELVYYKNGLTLMQRKLAHPDAVGNSLRTTCPPNLATSTCSADPKLAEYVSSMDFDLYDQDGVLTTAPSLARSVKITINMQRNAPGSNPLNLTTNMQVTLRNRF